jgi:hypothetical protein
LTIGPASGSPIPASALPASAQAGYTTNQEVSIRYYCKDSRRRVTEFVQHYAEEKQE